MKARSVDAVTDKINNTFRVQYAYIYRGKISDLKIEKGKAIGFEEWPLEKVLNLNDADKKKFISLIYSREFMDLFRQIKTLIAK